MKRLRSHPVLVTLLAFLIAAGTVVAIAAAYGFSNFADAWKHLHPGWLALALGAEVLALPSYALAHWALARVDGGPSLAPPLVLRVVLLGFGPSAHAGGFAIDKLALQAILGDATEARRRVLGFGGLEWALLAPAAWVAAVVLLATGDPRPMPSLLWPWAVAVPIGFAGGFWLARERTRTRIGASDSRWRKAFAEALGGVAMLMAMGRDLRDSWRAWVGTALYWVCGIAVLYGSLRFIGLRLNLGETIVAFATGYALTRRTLPLGGAGITEAFMTFAVHWTGQPVAPALAAVVVYRVFNLILPAGPALLVWHRLDGLLTAAEQGREATESELRRAEAPLGRPRR